MELNLKPAFFLANKSHDRSFCQSFGRTHLATRGIPTPMANLAKAC